MSNSTNSKKLSIKKTAVAAAVSKAIGKNKLPPVRYGLTVVAGQGAAGQRLIREVFTHAAITASKELPIPMPKVNSVTSLFVGSRRDRDLMKASLAAMKESGIGKNYEHQYLTSADPIDLTSPSGLPIVKRKMSQVDGWLILEHVVGTPPNPMNIEGLLRIRQAALKRKMRVMLIVMNPHQQDGTTFSRIADEYFEVTACEPDPGWDEAIVIDCVALTRGLGHAAGKVMCLAKVVEGRYVTQIVPFVSASAKTRLMAILRAMGKTLEQIGKLVALDKSGVSRHLQGIRSIPDSKLSKDELECWFEAYGIDSGAVVDDANLEASTSEDEATGDGAAKVVAGKQRTVRIDRKGRNKKDRKTQ